MHLQEEDGASPAYLFYPFPDLYIALANLRGVCRSHHATLYTEQ